jgi:hypothetical protein
MVAAGMATVMLRQLSEQFGKSFFRLWRSLIDDGFCEPIFEFRFRNCVNLQIHSRIAVSERYLFVPGSSAPQRFQMPFKMGSAVLKNFTPTFERRCHRMSQGNRNRNRNRNSRWFLNVALDSRLKFSWS